MLNAATQYATYVVDVEDIADSRDFEVIVHALLGGAWHRVVTGVDETACGVPFMVRHRPITRREVLSERQVFDAPASPMCRDCFHEHELTRALANDRAALEREIKEAEIQRKRDEEFFAALKRKRPTQGDR
jgi:hypothetical protein